MWGWWSRIVRVFSFFSCCLGESHEDATDNARPEVGLVQRRESPIIGLRNFNNWIKSVLITKFAHPALSPPNGKGKVLDMGCGKGGDLAKWSKARVREYVGLGTHTPPLFALTHSLTSDSDPTPPTQTSPQSQSTKPGPVSNPSTAASTPSSSP